VQPLSDKQDSSPNEPQVDVIVMQVIQALGCRGVKGSAMVIAEDKDTGLLLRADVIVDKIHSFKIVKQNCQTKMNFIISGRNSRKV
jgi:hypothetical protein